jgi:hypothetical protein
VFWFIPFANLVLPFLAIRDLAEWSRPPSIRPIDSLLAWWWAGWVGAPFVIVTGTVLQLYHGGPVWWIAAVTVEVMGTLVRLADGVLAIRVVRLITEMQRVKARESESAGR